MKAPDNLWFMAFQPSGVFKSRENCFSFFFSSQLIQVPYYTEAGMIIMSVTAFFIFFINYSLIVSFFVRTSNKRMKSFMGK